MGLSGPKNRTKISADPNNTAWSRSTDRFGHKILVAQGWQPGSYLGAKDAAHSDHYTAANASHIRVAVKDDTLGLGAKRGKAEAETFGLNAFQGLLGRLNGKSDVELKKEEGQQRDLKLKIYQGQRWGTIQFVSGGFLVGDKIEAPSEKPKSSASSTEKSAQPATEARLTSEEPLKKRKRNRDAETGEEAVELKKKKKKSDLSAESEESGQENSDVCSKKRSKSRSKSKDASSADSSGVTSTAASGDEKSEKKKRKLEKKARKEAKKAAKIEKRAKKEARRAERERKNHDKSQDNSSSEFSSSDEEDAAPKTGSVVAVEETKAAPSFAGGRLAVRQRYIRQKKMASMDPQALKEIFMVKAQA